LLRGSHCNGKEVKGKKAIAFHMLTKSRISSNQSGGTERLKNPSTEFRIPPNPILLNELSIEKLYKHHQERDARSEE
jgi:hypothetical protein